METIRHVLVPGQVSSPRSLKSSNNIWSKKRKKTLEDQVSAAMEALSVPKRKKKKKKVINTTETTGTLLTISVPPCTKHSKVQTLTTSHLSAITLWQPPAVLRCIFTPSVLQTTKTTVTTFSKPKTNLVEYQERIKLFRRPHSYTHSVYKKR